MKFTTRGLRRIYGYVFRGETLPTNFYLALATAASAPAVSTKTMAEMQEIAAGNGYTSGGVSLGRNATDFSSTAVDAIKGVATCSIATKTVTASGGSVPASGDAARYILLTGDNGTTVAEREVWAYFDFGYDESAPDTAAISISGLTLRLNSILNASAAAMQDILQWIFQGVAAPTNLYLALLTNEPDFSTGSTMGDYTEITAGNGYTAGGLQYTRDTVGFPSISVNESSSTVTVSALDAIWSASGGSIPASGSGASYLVITTDEGTIASRTILGYWPIIGAPKTATDGTQIAATGITITAEAV